MLVYFLCSKNWYIKTIVATINCLILSMYNNMFDLTVNNNWWIPCGLFMVFPIYYYNEKIIKENFYQYSYLIHEKNPMGIAILKQS